MFVGLGAEDQGVHREQRVEPAARLVDRLDDELRRELHRLGAALDVRVADLGRGHRPGVEPRVDDRLDPAGLLRAGATRHDDLVDAGPVRIEVAEVASRERGEFGQRPHAREVVVGTTPDRQRRAPVAVAR